MSDAPRLYTANTKLAKIIARDYFFPGCDHQDVEQEDLIALWTAARDFNPSRTYAFKPFARLVIHGKLSRKVRDHNRHKQLVLTDAERGTVYDDGDELDITDSIPSPGCIDDHCNYIELLPDVKRLLSPLELQAIGRAMAGYPCTQNPMCNALNRARTKMREAGLYDRWAA